MDAIKFVPMIQEENELCMTCSTLIDSSCLQKNERYSYCSAPCAQYFTGLELSTLELMLGDENIETYFNFKGA